MNMSNNNKVNPFKRVLLGLLKAFVVVTALPVVYLLIPPKKFFSSKEDFEEKMEKGAVLVVNHTEWLDGPLLTLTFLKYKLNFIIAKDVYDSKSIIRNFSEITHCVPCDRNTLDFVQYSKIVNQVKNGAVYVIFPQGQISQEDNCSDNFMAGGAMISIMSNRPVIPIYKSKSKLFRRTVINVGQAIQCNPSGKGLYEDAKILNNRSSLEIEALKKLTIGEDQ